MIITDHTSCVSALNNFADLSTMFQLLQTPQQDQPWKHQSVRTQRSHHLVQRMRGRLHPPRRQTCPLQRSSMSYVGKPPNTPNQWPVARRRNELFPAFKPCITSLHTSQRIPCVKFVKLINRRDRHAPLQSPNQLMLYQKPRSSLTESLRIIKS